MHVHGGAWPDRPGKATISKSRGKKLLPLEVKDVSSC